MDSVAVDPSRTPVDLITIWFKVVTVMVVVALPPCKGTLVDLRVLRYAALNDIASVMLPARAPEVTAAINDLNDPCTPRQRISVSLTHSVASADVRCTLDIALVAPLPNPEPSTVILVDPVVGVFEK